MQNRSFPIKGLEKAPIELNPEFPFLLLSHSFSNKKLEKLHIHDALELGLCVKGKGIFVIEDKVFSFSPGNVFFINHLEMHRACSPSGQICQWYFILLDPARLLGAMVKDPGLLDTTQFSGRDFQNQFPREGFPGLHTLISKSIKETDSRPPYYRDTIRSLMVQFLVEINRHAKLMQKSHSVARSRNIILMHRLKPALEKISTSYHDQLSVETLASFCAASTGHFRRLFIQAFGKSPQDYINDYRMGMICTQLRTTDKSILNIAMDCGFPTLSCFNRQFRKRMGCAPRQWRKREIS
jgi:AraC-like DNA-binding protein